MQPELFDQQDDYKIECEWRMCEKWTERAVPRVVSLNEVEIESMSAARLEVQQGWKSYLTQIIS